MIKPCGHRVLVKPLPTESKTASGIIMPESVKDKGQRDQQKGHLVSVGSMAWKAFDRDDPDWKPWAEVGDLVLFSRYGGKSLFEPTRDEKGQFDGGQTEFRILNDEDIAAIVSEDITT